jgi:hypothetical protein
MNRINIRADAALHLRLHRRGAGADLVFSTFIRRILEQAADPGGCYIYSSQDEILARQAMWTTRFLPTPHGQRAARYAVARLKFGNPLITMR